MSTRRWWLVVAALATTVVVALAVVWLTRPATSDCQTVREILSSNDDHSSMVARNTDGETPAETSESDYQTWAAHLGELADEVTEPDLAEHANRVADLADQTVSVVRQARDDVNRQPETTPPPWVSDYAKLNAKFADELHLLGQRCPA